MSKKRVLPLVVIGLLGLIVGGCHAEAKIGSAEPKAATPPPPPPAPPPPPPPPEPVQKPAIKAIGRAKIVNDEIQIPGKIHFDLDKATLKEDAETKEILDTVQKVLTENKQITLLRVEGHTDDKGTKEHNATLSTQRADAVKNWLVTKGTIDATRLTTIGFGPDRPLEKNDNEEHREKNRRTEFKIWALDGKPTAAANAEPAPGTPPPAMTKDALGKPGSTPGTPGTPTAGSAKPAGNATTPPPVGSAAPKK